MTKHGYFVSRFLDQEVYTFIACFQLKGQTATYVGYISSYKINLALKR